MSTQTPSHTLSTSSPVYWSNIFGVSFDLLKNILSSKSFWDKIKSSTSCSFVEVQKYVEQCKQFLQKADNNLLKKKFRNLSFKIPHTKDAVMIQLKKLVEVDKESLSESQLKEIDLKIDLCVYILIHFKEELFFTKEEEKILSKLDSSIFFNVLIGKCLEKNNITIKDIVD